jgi:GNAT superfamily N-acetyltransferase
MALWQIRTKVRDEPGTLAKLATALGRLRGNIVSVDIHRCDAEHVHDDLYIDVPDRLDADALRHALPRQWSGAQPEEVQARAARVQELVDGPSRALDLMARLISDQTALPGLLCQLLNGDSAELSGHRPPDAPHQLVVAVPWHRGYVVIRRVWAPFSLTERARAERFVAAAAAVESERVRAGTRAVLVDGTELRIRLGTPHDKAQVTELLDRCSAESRRMRFGAPADRLPSGWLDALAAPSDGFAVLAFTESGKLVGMAQCLPYEKPACGEIALLVEDSWQRHGIGTLLLRQVIRQALATGVEELLALSLPENNGPERLFARVGLPGITRQVDGIRELRAKLRASARLAQ